MRNTSSPIVLAAALLTFAPSIHAQINLLTNGSFAGSRDGWTVDLSAPPNNGDFQFSYEPGWESTASNLAYDPLTASVANPGTGSVVVFEDTIYANDPAQWITLRQDVSGLHSALDANGDITVWFDLYWAEGIPQGLNSNFDVVLDGVRYAGFRTHGNSTATLNAYSGAFNGASLDAGYTSASSDTEFLNFPKNTWTRFALTIPDYGGADTATLAFQVYGAVGPANNARDDWRLDNVIIASNAPVPEPSGALLFAAAGFFELLRRRRNA